MIKMTDDYFGDCHCNILQKIDTNLWQAGVAGLEKMFCNEGITMNSCYVAEVPFGILPYSLSYK